MSGSESIITLQNGWTPAFAANVTLGTTIDDWRTIVLKPGGKGTITSTDLSASRNAVMQAPDNMVIMQSWAASGIDPVWKIGVWRYADVLKGWVLDRAAIVTVTAHSTTGSSTFIGDTLYPPLSHSVTSDGLNVKVSDGNATYKTSGSFMFDTTGGELVTAAPYHASSATKTNLLVSGW